MGLLQRLPRGRPAERSQRSTLRRGRTSDTYGPTTAVRDQRWPAHRQGGCGRLITTTDRCRGAIRFGAASRDLWRRRVCRLPQWWGDRGDGRRPWVGGRLLVV